MISERGVRTGDDNTKPPNGDGNATVLGAPRRSGRATESGPAPCSTGSQHTRPGTEGHQIQTVRGGSGPALNVGGQVGLRLRPIRLALLGGISCSDLHINFRDSNKPPGEEFRVLGQSTFIYGAVCASDVSV